MCISHEPADAESVAPVTRSVLLDQQLPTPRQTHRVEIRRITVAPGHAGG